MAVDGHSVEPPLLIKVSLICVVLMASRQMALDRETAVELVVLLTQLSGGVMM